MLSDESMLSEVGALGKSSLTHRLLRHVGALMPSEGGTIGESSLDTLIYLQCQRY